VIHFMKRSGLSQRRACLLIDLQRCSFRYWSRRKDDAIVRERLKQLAREHPRWGHRFLGCPLGRCYCVVKETSSTTSVCCGYIVRKV
jgi:putative transposase